VYPKCGARPSENLELTNQLLSVVDLYRNTPLAKGLRGALECFGWLYGLWFSRRGWWRWLVRSGLPELLGQRRLFC